MAGGRHPTWQTDGKGLSRTGGPPASKLLSSRAAFFGVGAAVLLATVLITLATMAAGSPSDGRPPAEPQPAPGEPTATPKPTPTPTPPATPRAEFTEATSGPDGAAAPDISIAASVSETTSSTVQDPRTVASSWSAGPAPAQAETAPAATGDAARLADYATRTYGARIVLDGQDWGAGEAAQEANVQAVISAIDRLPDTVISAVVAHPHGALTFVSNDWGRTLNGWQPYGGHPMTYYTNSDQGPAGYRPANQVVLSVGAGGMSIAHEVLHAYQLRNVGPDEYALALLQPEMRSFMAATGWRQTGSDDEVRQAVNQPWAAVDSLFTYEGRPLTYTSAGGGTGAFAPPNPVEAFAVAGSVYYARPSWMTLPDWPEYWAWFDSNLG